SESTFVNPWRLFDGGYDAGGRFGHGVGADDGQPRVGQHFLAQFFVGALHADDQRHVQVDGLARGDHAFGDDVAAHDAAEDVDQDGLHALVLEHDLEGFGHFLGRGAAANVQEVGRLAAEQLDGVHGGHGQAGAVDQAADVAVELDVGQVELAGFDFSGIFFVEVAVGDDLGVAEQRVGIEVELGVQGDDVALAVAVQGVDFHQRGVGVHVALVQLLEHVGSLVGRTARQADGFRHLLGLLGLQAGERVDVFGDDFLGRRMGDFFDVHAAFARGDDGDLLGGAVGDQRHVVFLLDVGAVFDVQAVDLLSFGAGLVRDQLHAQDFRGQLAYVVERTRQLHATALATATGVDLRLHDPYRPTQLFSGSHGLVDGKSGDPARHGDAKLLQQFLALILGDFHVLPVRTNERERGSRRARPSLQRYPRCTPRDSAQAPPGRRCARHASRPAGMDARPDCCSGAGGWPWSAPPRWATPATVRSCGYSPRYGQ